MPAKSPKSFKFTDKTVKDLKPTEKRVYYHDTIESDLLLQITPNGAKTFYIYRRMDGQPQRYKLGNTSDMSVKQAREETIKIRAKVLDGINPQKTRKDLRKEDTLDMMYQKFTAERKGGLAKSTYNEYQRMWKKDLRSIFGKKTLSQITTETLRRFHKKYSQKTPFYANRCLVLIKTMFNYFIKDGSYKGENPTRGIKLNKENPRIRYLDRGELDRFFEALSQLEDSVGKNAILMIAFTGARKSNVYHMRWDEIDLQEKVWKMSKTKTGENITIPLADASMEILRHIQVNNPDPVYVFPSPTSASGHIVDTKRLWKRLTQKAKITNFRPHDLRHTLGTYLTAEGAGPFITQRLLTHKRIESTQVYVNLGVEHLRNPLNNTVNKLLGKNKADNDKHG
jgi:integrase